jgi:hypothetical protein
MDRYAERNGQRLYDSGGGPVESCWSGVRSSPSVVSKEQDVDYDAGTPGSRASPWMVYSKGTPKVD